jgi:hypothetical protein
VAMLGLAMDILKKQPALLNVVLGGVCVHCAWLLVWAVAFAGVLRHDDVSERAIPCPSARPISQAHLSS